MANGVKKTIIIIGVLFMSACGDGGHFLFDDPNSYIQQEPGRTRHAVFFESAPMQPAKYEPLNSTLIGLYTDALPAPDGRVIANVEASLGVNHAVFMEVIRLGDDFPSLWILECIAEHKIPVIVMLPPDREDPFGNQWEQDLTEVALAFSEFSMPMYVIFYPVPANSGWDTTTYIAFFRYARALFAIHAPHVAFIWAVDSDVVNFTDYFPGSQAIDWVGLSIFSSYADLMPGLLPMDRFLNFYHTFQLDAPIMLNLGLSHFSTDDHRYHISETAEAMIEVYRNIVEGFPRIRMVIYMDISRTDYNGQDFRINMDSALRAAYRESVSNFMTGTPPHFDDNLFTLPIRSAYTAIVDDGQIFIDIRIFEELNLQTPYQFTWMDGARMVDAEILNAVLYRGQVHITPPKTVYR